MAFDMNALQRAKYLCSPEGEKMVNSKKGSASAYSYSENDIPTQTYLSENDMRNNGYMPQSNGGPRTINETALPDIIKQSFNNLSIDVSSLDPNYKNMSAFDDVVKQMTEQTKKERQVITEEIIQPTYNNSGIDYNLIAKIIEECLDRKLKSLNENTLKGIKLKNGKISLSDHQGNVYQASLEYKGNMNEKKK